MSQRKTDAANEKRFARDPGCRKIHSMIPGFLSGTLHDRETEYFIEHVQLCEKCREQLETQCMIEKTISILNDKSIPYDASSFDMRSLLAQLIEDRTEELKRKRLKTVFRLCILIATLTLSVLLILDMTGIFHVTSYLGDIRHY